MEGGGGRSTYSLNDVVDELLGLVHFVLGIGHNKTVQIFFLVAGMSCVRTALALLDGTFATNGNLCTRLGLHLLQSVATRTDE